MKLSPVEDHAIAARMALVVGANTFDRLFAGVLGYAPAPDVRRAARDRIWSLVS